MDEERIATFSTFILSRSFPEDLFDPERRRRTKLVRGALDARRKAGAGFARAREPDRAGPA